MDGQMGECPDWWVTIQAARYLGVAPWDLMNQSIYWTDKARTAITAEAGAAKIKQEQH
jgi:hypothetical protein